MIFETCSRACIKAPFLKGIMVHLVVFQRWNKVFSSIIQMQRSGFNLCTGQFQNCPSPPPRPLSIWLEFCTVQWRIWPKIRPAQFVIWLSCQYHKQRDFVILSTFSMCTTFMGQCSFTIFLVHLQGFEKNISDVGFTEWNEQTYVRQLSETLDILVVSCRLFTFWKKCLMH